MSTATATEKASLYRKTHKNNVTIVTIRHKESFNRQFLLSSDRHWDNPHSKHDLQVKHLNQAMERKAGIIDLGDLFCAMQGKYDPRANKQGCRPEHQVDNYLDALVDTASDFFAPYTRNIIQMSSGNHECVDGDTEVATREGWKRIAEVTINDDVLSLHPITKDAQFSKPLKVHKYDHDGAMVSIRHRNVDMLITMNHRVAYLTQKTEELRFTEASKLLGDYRGRIHVPSCGVIDQPENGIGDDEIRLAAWILTDGNIEGRAIYQSKPEMIQRIRDLLSRMALGFSERSRPSKTREICGVKLKKEPLPQTTFSLHASVEPMIRKLQLVSKKRLPSWVFSLSKRQFDLFLEEIILGDGSRHKYSKTSMMVYGTKDLLDSLQLACVMYGYRAMLSKRKRNGDDSYYCLNIVERAGISFNKDCAEVVPHNGSVYCLTMASANFFARRNGKVFVTGNSSVLKRCETNLTARLVNSLNTSTGSNIFLGGYSGWIMFRFSGPDRVRTKKLWYIHGYGGGGAVTRGVLEASRRATYLPDADIIVSGHIHESWLMAIPRVRLREDGFLYQDEQSHICLPTYKEEYGEGQGGFHIEKGRPPKPLGAVWLTFNKEKGSEHIDTVITRAD